MSFFTETLDKGKAARQRQIVGDDTLRRTHERVLAHVLFAKDCDAASYQCDKAEDNAQIQHEE